MSELLAPNGKPSKLTTEQYMLVRTPAFKKWFGDWENDPENSSKVVDEETKEPLVVYHGTNANFNVFKNEIGIRGSQFLGSREVKSDTFFFTDNLELAEKFSNVRQENFRGEKNIIIAFLNIRNTLDFSVYDYKTEEKFEDIVGELPHSYFGFTNSLNQWWRLFDNDEDDITDVVKEKGYDGVILAEEQKTIKYLMGKYEYDLTVASIKSFGVFKPEQIKLADGTNTTFDGSNPDIRFDDGGEVEDLISQGIVELKMFATKPEHAKEYGLDSVNPLFIQSLNVNENQRLKSVGKKVLQYIDDYAIKNGHDVVFGHITQKAKMTKDNRTGYFTEFTDIDFIKHWLFRNGYNVNRETNDFYKVIESDSNDINNEYNPDIRFDDGGSVLLSPNGKPSRLTAKQYKLVHTDNFKQWYGDWENDRENSGIINGYTKEPIVFYHSTKSDFLSKKGENIFKNPPFFFSFKEDVSDYIVRIQHQNKKGRVYTKPFFLKFHKTFDLSQVKILKDEELTRLIKKHTFYQTEFDIDLLQLKLSLPKFRINTWFLTENEDFQDYIKNKGYDSFVVYEEGEKNIAVFKPNQIKLADGVNKTFDGSNPDVRFDDGGEVNIQSSVDFDKKYGTSISKTDWTYPKGYTTDEVYKKILLPISSSIRYSKKKWKVFEDYIADFNKSNFNYPHLKNLWEEDLWWVLWGMVSGYNYDDIVYFITKWHTDFDTEKPKNEKQIKELIRLGVDENDIRWIISPKTFNKIKKQLTEKFNNGGETNLDNINLTTYVVRFDTDDNSEIELITTDFEDAKHRYDTTSIGDYGDGSFTVSLEKKVDTYKFVYELDEDETIEDYPVEEYFEDSYFYKLIEDGEAENIEHKVIESVNSSSNDLLNNLENWAKNKFGNYKYNIIPVYAEDDDNEPIGNIQLRISDHSQNENNLPFGVNRTLSVVIANKDATRGRFQQNRPQIYFDANDSFDNVVEEIENYIEEAKDYIRSKFEIGGETKNTGILSQVWEWFGIKF
jgi:hypothetical protein